MPPTPDFRIFVHFLENVDFGKFSGGVCGLGGLQWIGNGCGIQIDRFSGHFEPYGSILYDFHDFGHFGIVFDGLTLLQGGPRTR